MNIAAKREMTITLTLNEREGKLLTCLIGALSPNDAEAAIRRGLNFDEWIGKLENREVVEFTGNLYDGLEPLFY